MERKKLDVEMVRRGLVESIDDAQVLIDSRMVTVGGAVADKHSRLVAASEPIEVIVKPRYVGRGGEKLQAALTEFKIDVIGKHVVDVGSSTGGFTDCLLQNGAARVTAIDVGTNQLHESLRRDTRVNCFENTDVRSVEWSTIGCGDADLIVVDVSFVSITQIVFRLAEIKCPVVALIKPQFEATRVEVSRGRGVIRAQEIWHRTVVEVVEAFGQFGLGLRGVIESPLRGADGNREFLAFFDTESGFSEQERQEMVKNVVYSENETRE